METTIQEVKTLYLPLKAKWYDMIESGEKKEEYRDLSTYWCKRLIDGSPNETLSIVLKHYDVVCFRYGYTKRTMSFKVESICIGKGKPEWGAPDNDVFIIKFGEKINE